MRIIKFRGKRIDNGKWVYGMPYSFKPFWHKPIYGKPYILMFNPEWDLEAQFNYLKYPESFSHLEDSIWRVIPESVGQFIGERDKKHVEVYEGDILKGVSPYVYLVNGKKTGKICTQIYQIIYLDNEARFAAKSIKSQYPKNHIGLFAINQKDMSKYNEIIGNLTDNPELIESDTKNKRRHKCSRHKK